MSQHTRQVILYKDEEGYWIVECPSLKGCQTQGRTKEEALSNITEAIAGYIADARRGRSSCPRNSE